MAAPKVEDKDSMKGSLLAIKENGDAFWQTDSDLTSVIRGYADGRLEQLGAEDGATATGTFTVGPDERVYLVASQFIETLKDKELFDKDGINLALDDEDLRNEIIEVSFDDAFSEVTPVTGQAAHNIAARNRRREEKRLKELQTQRAVSSADASATGETQVDVSDTSTPATSASRTAQTAYERRLRDAYQQKRTSRSVPENTVVQPESAEAISDAESIEDIDDEERQYLEDLRRGFKVTDNRKWSRVEMLGHEVGIHSDVSFTVPPKPIQPKEAPTEILNVVVPAEAAPVDDEVIKDPAPTVAPEKETISVRLQGSTVPFEELDYNPNNDPAIEHGLAQLSMLRAEMASLTANRQNRLFNLNGKKSREIARTYNDQVVTLGRIVTADKLSDAALTDSQKNVLVTKFLVNEQVLLPAATKERLEGTKEGKLVEWMSIRGRTADSAADVRKVIQAIERGAPDDDKVAFAYRHLTALYSERVRGEKKERMKSAARVAAIGVVGMAATVLGINPSAAGDAANAIFYGTRKR
jgi:hypothetical protein